MPVSARPAPALRPYVRRYDGFREEVGRPLRRREGPGGDVVLLLSFGQLWRIASAAETAPAWRRHTSFVGGLRGSCVLTEHDGLAHGIQVSLTPPGAYALLGLPLHELAEQTIDVEPVLGSDARGLDDRLAALGGWEARFRLLDSLLARRLDGGRIPDAGVVHAWRRIEHTRGHVAVGDLAAELGWSRKRLVARFREQIGLGPKTLARVLRFERARTLLERDHAPARVAFACGYADQAHLSREVRRIAGVTPSALAAGETNLQDAAPELS